MRIFNAQGWIQQYADMLQGKRVALFGATGGIGNVVASYILKLGGELVTIDRNRERSESLRKKLQEAFPGSHIVSFIADLSDMDSVERICPEIERIGIDILIHNAGAYSIPRMICDSGFDNVFQINFVAPYYITMKLLPYLSMHNGRVIVVGSIAHNYSKTDPEDIDFRKRKQASLAYGNAKRYWMYSTFGLAEEYDRVRFSVVHPGITFTNITAHYPKWIFAIIKHPMKVIFMPPKYAALSIIQGIFDHVPAGSWIGPSMFRIWGKPSVRKLRTATRTEYEYICKMAKQIYEQIQRS